jgi:hypothetical protein
MSIRIADAQTDIQIKLSQIQIQSITAKPTRSIPLLGYQELFELPFLQAQ